MNKNKSSMEGNYVTRKTHKGESFGFEEHTWGTSWPARNYACSFCKREFKSAQALGGHMNVHRRDRARLRSSSWVSECLPKPNPNNNLTHLSPSSSPSYLSDALLNCSHPSPLYCPCLSLSSSLPPASTCGDKKLRLTPSYLPPLSPQSREIKMSSKNTRSALGDELKVFNNDEHNIALELGIGLFKHPKENLDLELRLGNF